MTSSLTRRHLLTAGLAAGIAVPLGAGRGWAAPARLTLPPPTGPHPVGTVSLHLVDSFRPDRVAGPRHRDMMASIWYPATGDARHHPVAPWLPDAPMRALLESVDIGSDVAAAPRTAGHEGAPALRGSRPRPVVVFSHGSRGHRSETTIVVQELVSHGYVVVTVDHPDDSFSEFPDGRITVPADVPVTPWDHARDIRFVLDRLQDLVAGRNPDAERRPLPSGLSAVLDLRRIGMYGWSKGATATALVMNTDRRVRAGLSLDGPMQSQPPAADIDRPFMLMTAEFTPGADESNVAEFWPLLHGWRLQLHACGAAHSAYADHVWLIPQLPANPGSSDEEPAAPIDPAQAVRIQQAYPLAFFDLHLRHRRQRLLQGPSPAFPEVHFVA